MAGRISIRALSGGILGVSEPGSFLSRSAAALSLHQGWDRYRSRRRIIAVATSLLVLVAFAASLVWGGAGIRLAQVLLALMPPAWNGSASPVQLEVVRDLRLPRTLMAIIAGAGLAISGAAMQGVTRNILVSPYTLGVSPAAAFGAAMAIMLGVGSLRGAAPFWIVGAAFLSALLCAGFVLTLSALRGVSSTTLVLSGVGLTYLFAAMTSTAQFFGTEQQLAAIVHWTFGSLNGATWSEVFVSGGILLLAAPLVLAHAAALNAFAAGDDEVATSLGVAVIRTRLLITVAAVLITAGIVSFVGVIGFVGLVAPHVSRMTIGGDYKALLPHAGLVGALLLLVADLIGRVAFAPVIIPVGIVVAFIGVPLFLQLLLTRRQEGMD
jgi:iron complex transport system permease protein